jgi:hypothetical protein
LAWQDFAGDRIPVDHLQFLEASLILGTHFGGDGDVSGAAFRLGAEQAQCGTKADNVVPDAAGAVDDLRGIQNGIRRREWRESGVIGEGGRGECLKSIPVRVVACGKRLAHARWPIAEVDVAILPTGVAEFCEAAELSGDQKGTRITHFDSV